MVLVHQFQKCEEICGKRFRISRQEASSSYKSIVEDEFAIEGSESQILHHEKTNKGYNSKYGQENEDRASNFNRDPVALCQIGIQVRFHFKNTNKRYFIKAAFNSGSRNSHY